MNFSSECTRMYGTVVVSTAGLRAKDRVLTPEAWVAAGAVAATAVAGAVAVAGRGPRYPSAPHAPLFTLLDDTYGRLRHSFRPLVLRC